MRWTLPTLTMVVPILVVMIVGCAGMNGGAGWNTDNCAMLTPASYAESFVCSQPMGDDPEKNAKVCHHSMLSGFHGAMALCYGLSDSPE